MTQTGRFQGPLEGSADSPFQQGPPGPPSAPPDHQQPQTTGKRNRGPPLGRSSPSRIERDPQGAGSPDLPPVLRHETKRGHHVQAGCPPRPSPRGVVFAVDSYPQAVPAKMQRTPGPRRLGLWAFLVGPVGRVVINPPHQTRSSHAPPPPQMASFAVFKKRKRFVMRTVVRFRCHFHKLWGIFM